MKTIDIDAEREELEGFVPVRVSRINDTYGEISIVREYDGKSRVDFIGRRPEEDVPTLVLSGMTRFPQFQNLKAYWINGSLVPREKLKLEVAA